MELASGELYFIRERDPLTREVSNYVKIGLVKDNGARTSYDKRIKNRLKEVIDDQQSLF